MLVLDDGSMRISVRVICLQVGVLNQQIRVVRCAKPARASTPKSSAPGLLHARL